MPNQIVYILKYHSWADNDEIQYIFATPELREWYMKKYPKRRWIKEDQQLMTEKSYFDAPTDYPKYESKDEDED